ncbi:MAG: ATP phosphoribosyltransferase [Oscillospiraceae bacterium]|jgi:ATP phosphoribosyltransferase|nr:ATP phosphoribosyltransferase [Oscillospiraceae bacterium]
MRPIRIALTKGRLEKKSLALFETMGLDCTALREKGRRLILPMYAENDIGDETRIQIEAVLAKAADVITYVRHGVCDFGIVGKDTLAENGAGVYEVLRLPFGVCKFALAGKSGVDFYAGHHERSIATKYPTVARRFFAQKGMDVNIIKIEGSVELAPLLGLSDAIVDIVETGGTLAANGLEVIEDIQSISARVIANVASMKLRHEQMQSLLDDMAASMSVAEF